MKKENNNKKKPNYINKVNTTRIDRNRKRYRQVVPKKSISPLFLFLFLLSILGNFFLVGHYITFDHNKVRVETKTRKVVTVSPNYLFLGDSITDFYDLEKYFPDDPVVNSGINGDQTTDILEDMEERVYQYNPSKVFLLIGTNDLQHERSIDEIVDNIKKIVEGIKENRPEAEIYIESIYPINNTDAEKIDHDMVGRRTNEDIMTINEKLQQYCQENDVVYIDLYNELIDEDGNLKEEYTKEGLHMSDEGYEAITEKLKQYMDEEV